jgi:flagellar biosynthesis protein FliR
MFGVVLSIFKLAPVGSHKMLPYNTTIYIMLLVSFVLHTVKVLVPTLSQDILSFFMHLSIYSVLLGLCSPCLTA